MLGAPGVQRVLGMQGALEAGAWAPFLRAALGAPYLQACLAHMYFAGVRARALTTLAATGARPLPVEHHLCMLAPWCPS